MIKYQSHVHNSQAVRLSVSLLTGKRTKHYNTRD